MDRMFLRILKELGWPPIYLIPPEQFQSLDGDKVGALAWGIASIRYPTISLLPGLSKKPRINTIYHELAHHLWPWKPHWWIECFAEKMAEGGGRGWYSRHYNHTVDDLPSRDSLLRMARRQSEKLKVKYQVLNFRLEV